MIDIKQVLLEYAASTPHKFKETSPGKYCIDFTFILKDGSKRLQMVWCWVAAGRGKGKDCVYFTSRSGTWNPEVNMHQLLKESGFGFYSTVTIVSDTDKTGNPCETVVVQASPIHEYLTKEEFLFILWEVAEVADIVEEKYFGGDAN